MVSIVYTNFTERLPVFILLASPSVFAESSHFFLLKEDRKAPLSPLNLNWSTLRAHGIPYQPSISIPLLQEASSSSSVSHFNFTFMNTKFLTVSMGEPGRGIREEHSLYFILPLLWEPNYVIFVKASFLLSHCGAQPSLLADGKAP